MTPMQLYWILKLDSFRGISLALTIVFGVTFIVMLIGTLVNWAEDEFDMSKKYKKCLTIATPLFILFSIPLTFLPTTKEMCAIMVIPPIINNEQIQEMPQKILDLGNQWLDELKPKKKTEE